MLDPDAGKEWFEVSAAELKESMRFEPKVLNGHLKEVKCNLPANKKEQLKFFEDLFDDILTLPKIEREKCEIEKLGFHRLEAPTQQELGQ